jgi:regulation of enolase protein 1 (concanavalin A-like superfamily)
MGMARFADRPSDSNFANYTNGPAVENPPLWLRLNKSGDTVTAYSSGNGIDWTNIGSANVSYGTQYYVGFAVTSRESAPALAQFDSFMGVPAAGNSLPLAMTDLDIGTVGQAGFSTYVNGFYDTTASGTGIASTADSFHFTYAPDNTDGDYIAEVLNQDAMQEGIMVRSSLAANSAMAMVSLSNLYIDFSARAAAGAPIATTQSVAAANPVFLRLNKSGATLTGYYSADGYNWTQISSTTIAIGSSFYVGLATASGSSGTASGMFTGLSGVPAPLGFQVSPLNTTYQAPVTATVTVANTQNAAPTGTASIYDWGTLLTIVPLTRGTATWSISPSLLAGVHNLQAVYSGDINYPQETSPVQVATVTLAPGESGPCPLPAAPQNLSYTANASQVFLTWSTVDDTLSYTVSRSLTSGSGFTAIASGITGASYTDAYATSPTNAPYYLVAAVNACGSSPASVQIGPVQSTVLPSNFSNQDVGDVQTVGSSTYTDGVYTINGSGVDIGGTADSFQFAYSLVSSDGDFITRLVDTNAVKAGLMIRASLTASSPMAMVMLNDNMARFADRPDNGNFANYTNGPTVNNTPVWLRLNKSGDTITAYSSVDGVNWTNIGSASVTYGAQYYVGFAVTSWSSTLASGQFDSFMGVPTSANALPTAFTGLDIGTVGTAGIATYAGNIGEYDVFGSGTDIGGTSDSFHFSYVAMSTDGDYIAQVLNQDAIKEGIMVRASLSANSAMAMIMLNSGMARFAGRPNMGNYASYSNGPNVAGNPIWLRLNKTGSTVTGYWSTDKVNWTQIGSTTITFGSQFYVGFGVTSGITQTQAGMFSNLSGVPAPLTMQLSTANSAYGTAETVTVAPVNTQGATPTGSVSIYDSGTLLNTFALSSGAATGTISPALKLGTHSLTAVYSGDTVYPQETSAIQTVTVTQATPSITWATPSAITYGTALSATQFDATSTAAGAFAYTPAAGTVLGAGTQTLSATFTPTDTTDYTTATQTVQLTVNQASTTVVLSYSPSSPVLGQTEALAATVSGAGSLSGSVVFTSGSTTLCTVTPNASGVVSCSFTPATDGNFTVTAQYQGDSNHLPSSVTQTLFVYDGAVTLQAASTQLVYPGATNLTACIASETSTSATGTVQIYDGATLLTTQSVQGGGCAYWYISPGLNAGAHSLTAVYSGDAHNVAGTSLPTAVGVQPAPVTLSPACWNSNVPYGANYQCTVTVSSNAGAPQGSITYAYDGGVPLSLALSNGNAQFTIPEPFAGNHSVAIGYAQQTNYAAVTPVTENFTVTPAPVNVSLIPSSWYTSASGGVSFVAAVASWSAGPPDATGSVAFYDGGTLLATVPVNASGQATYTSSSLSIGPQTITATYLGGTNYGSGSASATITLTQ